MVKATNESVITLPVDVMDQRVGGFKRQTPAHDIANLHDRIFGILNRPDGLLSGNGPLYQHQVDIVFENGRLPLVRYPHGDGTLYALVDINEGVVKNYISSGSYAINDYDGAVYFVNGEGSFSFFKPGMDNFQNVPGSELNDFPGESYSSSDIAIVEPRIERLGERSISISVFRKMVPSGDESEYIFNPDGAVANRNIVIRLP